MLKKIGANVMVRTACKFFGGLLYKWLGPLGIALSMILITLLILSVNSLMKNFLNQKTCIQLACKYFIQMRKLLFNQYIRAIKHYSPVYIQIIFLTRRKSREKKYFISSEIVNSCQVYRRVSKEA